MEIYIDDYTLDVTVVEINYYLGEVSNVKTDDDDADYITVRALSEEPSLDDNTFYTTDFAEDDYVVFTVDFNEDEDFYICELMAPRPSPARSPASRMRTTARIPMCVSAVMTASTTTPLWIPTWSMM